MKDNLPKIISDRLVGEDTVRHDVSTMDEARKIVDEHFKSNKTFFNTYGRYNSENSSQFILDENFVFDALISVTGDFNKRVKMAYLEKITTILNEYVAQQKEKQNDHTKTN